MHAVEKYYTIKHAAELLDCCDDTIRRAMKAGKLGTCPNIGNAQQPSWRIPASGINTWLSSGSAPLGLSPK